MTVIGVFTHFFGIETTLEERQFFKKLAVLIGTRSARLSACGIAAIVGKMGYLEEGCAVGADGSLYNVSRGRGLHNLFLYIKIGLTKAPRNTPTLRTEFMRPLLIFLVKAARRLSPTMLRMVQVSVVQLLPVRLSRYHLVCVDAKKLIPHSPF